MFSAGAVYGLISMENPALSRVCLSSKQNQELPPQNLASTHWHIWSPHGPWFSPLDDSHHLPSPVTSGLSFNREVFINANDMLVFVFSQN